MCKMKKQITATSQEHPDAAVTRIENYLNTIGFRLIEKDSSRLRFKRGSLLGSLTSNKPRKWKSEILVSNQSHSDFQVILDINTTGQTVESHEEEFWEIEIDNIKKIIEGEDIVSTQEVESSIARVAKNAIVYSIVYALVCSGVILLLTALLKLLGVIDEPFFSAGVAAGIGAGLGFAHGITKSDPKPKS